MYVKIIAVALVGLPARALLPEASTNRRTRFAKGVGNEDKRGRELERRSCAGTAAVRPGRQRSHGADRLRRVSDRLASTQGGGPFRRISDQPSYDARGIAPARR